jgi:carboxyl-terminal processing protease
MRRNIWWVLLAFSTTVQALELSPLQQQPMAARLTGELLTRHHYKAMPLDDALSEKIFERYIKSLDAEKYFFNQRDIEQLNGLRTRLDDAIIDGDLRPPFGVFNRYAQRVIERYSSARTLLKEGFDFTQHESFQFSREKAAWPKSDEEIHELWRKRVKNDWLRLKLAGKDDKSIAETLDKRYEASIRRMERMTSEDVFQIFMNAYTMSIEPHTNYLGPRAAESFGISMKLSLVGIGAVLQEKEEYTTIREIMAGSPAALSKQLKVGDRIVGVAQGENGPLTDVLGWRLDDTVRLIRGEADSLVMLDILPVDAGPDGKHKLVSLVRKKITLEEQAAKKSIIPVTNAGVTRQIGVITLPSFYQDFEARQKGDANFKSATRDVERILADLKKQKVDSVLIDLRGNGGGSLVEAIELTGLFIDQGPVVQQRDARGNISVESDTQAGVAWSGPVGVLINQDSASASEIFAAAIQDYGRGLILGEPSFGKGTVQTMLNLDNFARNEQPLFGDVKMTVAQFFRINGGTTQLQGVTPDIRFPMTAVDGENRGESSFDNALPWVQITAAEYSPAENLRDLVPALQIRHESRIKSDEDFRDQQDDIAKINVLRQKNLISLNEVERRQERAIQEARLAKREARKISAKGGKGSLTERANLLRDDGLQADERSLSADLAAAEKRKSAKDIQLDEAARILGDEAGLLKSNALLAARSLPGTLKTHDRGNVTNPQDQ